MRCCMRAMRLVQISGISSAATLTTNGKSSITSDAVCALHWPEAGAPHEIHTERRNSMTNKPRLKGCKLQRCCPPALLHTTGLMQSVRSR
jgi:hypothetical protein